MFHDRWCVHHYSPYVHSAKVGNLSVCRSISKGKLAISTVITSTFTGDWLLTEGENRDKLGEWLNKTQIRYQDQRRILKSIRHCFPSNFWCSKITNSKESDKCDLCKVLWISQGRFTTESVLPVQTLGHIQHTCEALSEIHTMAHHRCWLLIHAELSRLASSV